jgi:hypothetical protein
MDQMIAASGDALPDWLASRLNAELRPGETLVWTGRPVPALAARGAWIFSLVGGVMLIPMVVMAVVIGAIVAVVALLAKSPCFLLVLLPFFTVLLVIVALVALVPFLARRHVKNTVYALTNLRAIIWQKGPFAFQVRSFAREQLLEFQRTERPDGTGDLIFEQVPWHDGHGHQHLRTIGFTSIARVRDVEELIRATLLTPPSPKI